MGYRFHVFVESGGAVSDRFLRAHRIYGDVDVDRSVDQFIRHSADEFCASEGGEESHRATGRVATIAAAAIGVDAPGVSVVGFNETMVGPGIRRMIAPNHHVLTGLDVLEQDKFAALKGRRSG